MDEAPSLQGEKGRPDITPDRHRVTMAPAAINAINRLCRLMRRGNYPFSRLRAVAVVKRAAEHYEGAPRKPRLQLTAYRRLSSPERNEYRLMVKPVFPDALLLRALGAFLMKQLFPDKYFLPECCGYIPGRGGREAVRQVMMRLRKGYGFVLRLDVQSFNETVPQQRLLGIIVRRAKEKGLDRDDLDFLKMLMRNFFFRVDEVHQTPRVGIGMGTSLTPLLTNIYLHKLDRYIRRQKIPFTRFGDDLTLFFRDQSSAQEASERVATFVSTELEQKMSDTKVRITQLRPVSAVRSDQSAEHGFDFCAYHFQMDEKGNPTIRIRESTIGKIRRKIKVLTRIPKEISREVDSGIDRARAAGECTDPRIVPLIWKINALLGFSSSRIIIRGKAQTSFLITGWPAAFLNEASSEEIKQQFKSLDRYILYRLKRFNKALGTGESGESGFGQRMRKLGLRTFMDAWNRHPRLYRYSSTG